LPKWLAPGGGRDKVGLLPLGYRLLYHFGLVMVGGCLKHKTRTIFLDVPWNFVAVNLGNYFGSNKQFLGPKSYVAVNPIFPLSSLPVVPPN
jgi:hypothetical protein